MACDMDSDHNILISSGFTSAMRLFSAAGTRDAKEGAWPPAPGRQRTKGETPWKAKFEVMETTIPKGRTLRIQDGKGFDLKVVAGCLWVTYEHDTDDMVLDPSDTFRVSRDGVTLVHALKEVQLRIAYPAEAGMPSLTLGGGYREFGASVWRGVLAEWLGKVRGSIAAGQGEQRCGRDRRGPGRTLTARRPKSDQR